MPPINELKTLTIRAITDVGELHELDFISAQVQIDVGNSTITLNPSQATKVGMQLVQMAGVARDADAVANQDKVDRECVNMVRVEHN